MKEGLRQNKRSIGKRESVSASVDAQAAIVRVLDAAASEDDLTDRQVEGAVALLITYQHGMRPVPALCLDVTHVRFFRDASDDLACVLSFHAAKQTPGNEFELLRQVKPEWVPLVREAARDGARSRAAAAIQRNRTNYLLGQGSGSLQAVLRAHWTARRARSVTPGRKRSPMRGMIGLASKRSSATRAQRPRRTTSGQASSKPSSSTRRSVGEILQQPLGHIDRQFSSQPTRYSWLLRTSRLALWWGIGWLLAWDCAKQ